MTDVNRQAKPKDAARAGDRERALPGRSSAPSGTPKPTTWSAATSRPWSIPPRARKACSSKSLTLDQATAVITAARTLPVMELHPA